MRRVGWALVLLVALAGGVTACGGDDGDDGDDGDGSVEVDTGDEGGDGDGGEGGDGGATSGGSDAVDAYCDAVDSYLALVDRALEDPEAFTDELEQAAQAYTDAAVEIGPLDDEEQARFDECSLAAAGGFD